MRSRSRSLRRTGMNTPCACEALQVMQRAVFTLSRVSVMMRSCRICSHVIDTKHAQALFSRDAVKDGFPDRISTIINLPVTENDGLPKHMCRPCNRRLTAAESFIHLARSSYEKQGFWSGKTSSSNTVTVEGSGLPDVNRKRPKNTSSSIDASPHTVQARPAAKRVTLQRRRLSFSQNEGTFTIKCVIDNN